MNLRTRSPVHGDTRFERLRALAALDDAALGRAGDDGWTVAATLAHLAYWEGRQVGAIEAWQVHGTPPAWWTREEADAVNAVRLSSWLAMPARETIEQAIATAHALDRVMERLPAGVLAQLPARRQDPAAHRGDHLDEIDRILGR